MDPKVVGSSLGKALAYEISSKNAIVSDVTLSAGVVDAFEKRRVLKYESVG